MHNILVEPASKQLWNLYSWLEAVSLAVCLCQTFWCPDLFFCIKSRQTFWCHDVFLTLRQTFWHPDVLVTQKRITVLYFLKTLQVRAPCHGGVLYSFVWIFEILKTKIFVKLDFFCFHVFFAFYAISGRQFCLISFRVLCYLLHLKKKDFLGNIEKWLGGGGGGCQFFFFRKTILSHFISRFMLFLMSWYDFDVTPDVLENVIHIWNDNWGL